MQQHPIQQVFHHRQGRYPVSVDGPSLKIIVSFARFRTNAGEMRIPGFGTRQAKSLILDSRYVSCQTCCLVVREQSRSDCGQETDSPFHAVPNTSRILNISAEVMMAWTKASMRPIPTIPYWRLRRKKLG